MDKVVELFGIDPRNVKNDLSNIFFFERDLRDIVREQLEAAEEDIRQPKLKTCLTESNKETAIQRLVEKLTDKLKKTDPTIVANYVGWRVVFATLPRLNKAARTLYNDFKNVVDQVDGQINVLPPLWKTCVQTVGFETNYNLNVVAGSMFLQYFSDKKSTKIVEEMTANIKKAFEEEILKKMNWLDEKTRGRALEKLHKMKSLIGGAKEHFNKTIIDDIHKNLIVYPDDYNENIKNLRKFWNNLNVTEYPWLNRFGVTTVNAQYDPVGNIFEIPTGILQFDFFDSKSPNYFNYGSTGSTIGHEMTHGFDNNGKKFNENGNNHLYLLMRNSFKTISVQFFIF